jgi:hypothetical protein
MRAAKFQRATEVFMPKTKPTTVDQYIEAALQEAREKLLPKGLIRKISAYRARQVKENDLRWMY